MPIDSPTPAEQKVYDDRQAILNSGTWLQLGVVAAGGMAGYGVNRVIAARQTPVGSVKGTELVRAEVVATEAEANFAGQIPVRPRDGLPAPGTPATQTPLGKHLIEAQVTGNGKNAAISGGHNMSNFELQH